VPGPHINAGLRNVNQRQTLVLLKEFFTGHRTQGLLMILPRRIACNLEAAALASTCHSAGDLVNFGQAFLAQALHQPLAVTFLPWKTGQPPAESPALPKYRAHPLHWLPAM